MKNLKFFTLAIAILGFTATSFAQNPTVSATSTVGATILTPIAITNNVNMNFGNIAPSATAAGTVTLDFVNGRTFSNVSLPTVAGTVKSAQFTVTGEGASAFTIVLPNDTAVKLTGDGADMTVTNFLHNAGAAPALSGGTKTFEVGATLNVAQGQGSGVYSGSFAVTVAYN